MGQKITNFPNPELHTKGVAAVAFMDDKLYVSLADGRLIAIPLT